MGCFILGGVNLPFMASEPGFLPYSCSLQHFAAGTAGRPQSAGFSSESGFDYVSFSEFLSEFTTF